MRFFTTLGYWWFENPDNKGALHVEVVKMSDWRFEFSVWGHEVIEVLYCRLFHITTEQADKFDQYYEDCYAAGTISKDKEPGHDPKCPYHWGHMAGVCWEYICILITLASWEKYLNECDRLMGINQPAPNTSEILS